MTRETVCSSELTSHQCGNLLCQYPTRIMAGIPALQFNRMLRRRILSCRSILPSLRIPCWSGSPIYHDRIRYRRSQSLRFKRRTISRHSRMRSRSTYPFSAAKKVHSYLFSATVHGYLITVLQPMITRFAPMFGRCKSNWPHL